MTDTNTSKCSVCLAGEPGQRLHKCPDSLYYVPGSDPGAERTSEAPPLLSRAEAMATYCRTITLAALTGQLSDDPDDTPTQTGNHNSACPEPRCEA